jgi:hypothetical protein
MRLDGVGQSAVQRHGVGDRGDGQDLGDDGPGGREADLSSALTASLGDVPLGR